MFTHHIYIYDKSSVKDEYNQSLFVGVQVAEMWAERTDYGGRENIYASRIVSENKIVYSTRFRDGIKVGMYVKDEADYYEITAVQMEGRKYRMHMTVALRTHNDINSDGEGV